MVPQAQSGRKVSMETQPAGADAVSGVPDRVVDADGQLLGISHHGIYSPELESFYFIAPETGDIQKTFTLYVTEVCSTRLKSGRQLPPHA